MGDDTYNGWANRETWVVNLWIVNDPALSDMVADMVADTIDRVGEEWVDRAAGEGLFELVAEWWCDDVGDTWRGGLWSDLVGTALGRVDWQTIVAPYVADRWDQMIREVN